MNSHHCSAKIYQPSEELWNEIKDAVIAIEHEVFPQHPETDGDLEKAFTRKENVIVLLHDRDKVVGYMYTVPIDTYRPYRANERTENVLVDNVAIKKDYQGHGYVGVMTELLEKELKKKGFIYFEIWANIPNGYADKIAKFYKDRVVGEPKRTDPAEDHLWGARRIYKILL